MREKELVLVFKIYKQFCLFLFIKLEVLIDGSRAAGVIKKSANEIIDSN